MEEKIVPKRPEIDFEQLIVRLERNHRSVLRHAKDLNSYRFEPKNYECFTKLRELKAAFSILGKAQMSLFDQIQHKLVSIDKASQQVEESIREYQRLEKRLAEYLLSL